MRSVCILRRCSRRHREPITQARSTSTVGDQTKALNRRVSGGDRKQLDEYFAAIRTAEKELAASDAWLDRPKPEVDVEIPKDIAAPTELLGRIRALMNLIPLMLQTDSTRVVSLMIQDHHVVPDIAGVQAGHHPLSHHGQDPATIAQLKIIESGSSQHPRACWHGLDSDRNRVLDCWITHPFFLAATWAMRMLTTQRIFQSFSPEAATNTDATSRMTKTATPRSAICL